MPIAHHERLDRIGPSMARNTAGVHNSALPSRNTPPGTGDRDRLPPPATDIHHRPHAPMAGGRPECHGVERTHRNQRTPTAPANAWAVARPARIPLKSPGPTSTATTSISAGFQPAWEKQK